MYVYLLYDIFINIDYWYIIWYTIFILPIIDMNSRIILSDFILKDEILRIL